MAFLKLQNWLEWRRTQIYTQLLKKDFGKIGKKSVSCYPFHSADVSGVFLGDDCIICPHSWIAVVKSYGGTFYDPKIEIGDGSYFGNRLHMIACGRMSIGKKVVCADGVYITDNLHGYQNIDKPILESPLVSAGPVSIGDQAWLGENVCVMPNVKIGKRAVIGANSVVTKDIPDFCVAVGTPAKVIKKYCFKRAEWIRV